MSGLRKKRRLAFIRTAIWTAVLFIALQIGISLYVKLDTVYHFRLNYNMFLDNQQSIEVVIDEISNTIEKENLQDYIILVGNSVAWGTNEKSDHSLGKYINELSGEQVVFNLSAPSMQPGDIYTLLLMLDRKGIRTDNLVIGLSYSAFVERVNGPRAVFWLGDYLRELDSEAFGKARSQLVHNGYEYRTGWEYAETKYLHQALSLLPLYRYKDAIVSHYEEQKDGTDLLGDPRPWFEKKYTEKKLQDPQYLNFFNPKPFVMSEENWGVFFMNRIMEHQEGKKTLVFINSANGELSKKEIANPGYQDNLRKLESYFAETEAIYLNLQESIPSDMFTDHVHLTKEGNQKLAQLLWQAWNGEVN
ncbi:hypothetical protein [Paenibacillus soyae]|uniref:Uncharacterized protein n=1 Tax=Paenibacillus soyae TaxID=2969249 RepID=A0A9X2MS36_9BACL|nr:hypothetical protein [Paenibacillus soyae]MCR2804813.1 hypothetical protein [Paenibacillus soyae]